MPSISSSSQFNSVTGLEFAAKSDRGFETLDLETLRAAVLGDEIIDEQEEKLNALLPQTAGAYDATLATGYAAGSLIWEGGRLRQATAATPAPAGAFDVSNWPYFQGSATTPDVLVVQKADGATLAYDEIGFLINAATYTLPTPDATKELNLRLPPSASVTIGGVAYTNSSTTELEKLRLSNTGGGWIREAEGSEPTPLSYIDASAANTVLTANRRHTVNGNRTLPPVGAVAGDWVTIRNLARAKSNAVNFAEFAATVRNPFETTDTDYPSFFVPPAQEYTFTLSGAGVWEFSPTLPGGIFIESSNSGLTLSPGQSYVVRATSATTLKLPGTPVSDINVILGAGSTSPLTIEQFDTGAVDQLLLEGFRVATSVTIPVEHTERVVQFLGNTQQGNWLVNRPYRLSETWESPATTTLDGPGLWKFLPLDTSLLWNNATAYAIGDKRYHPLPNSSLGVYTATAAISAGEAAPDVNPNWNLNINGDNVVGPFTIESQSNSISRGWQLLNELGYSVIVTAVDTVIHPDAARTRDNIINLSTGEVVGFAAETEGANTVLRQYPLPTDSANILASDLLDTETYVAADSTAPNPTSTTDLLAGWNTRFAQGGFTAVAQRQVWRITTAGTIEVAIPKADLVTTPVTIQVLETGTSNNFSVNVNLDGTLSQPAGDNTNELTNITATIVDRDEAWLVRLTGARPQNVDLIFWGNDIGDASDFQDYRYVFRVDTADAQIESTFQSLQMLYSTSTSTTLTANPGAVVDFGNVDLSNADLALLNVQFSSGSVYQDTCWVSLKPNGDIPALPSFYQTTSRHMDVDLGLSDLANGNIHIRSVGVATVEQAWFFAIAANGYVVPEGFNPLVERIATVTTPSGATTHQIFQGLSAPWIKLTPATGKEFTSGSFDSSAANQAGLIACVDCKGSISGDGTVVIEALGANPSITFTDQDVAAGTTTENLIGTIHRPAEFEIVNDLIETGHNLTSPDVQYLYFSFTDTGETGRPWNIARLDIEEGLENGAFYVWNHSGAYLTATIEDAATGQLRIADNARAVRYIASWVTGYAPTGYTVPAGTVAATPITVTVNLDGAAATLITGGSTLAGHELIRRQAQVVLPQDQILLNFTPVAGVAISIDDIDNGKFTYEVATGTGDVTLEFTTGERNGHYTLLVETGPIGSGDAIDIGMTLEQFTDQYDELFVRAKRDVAGVYRWFSQLHSAAQLRADIDNAAGWQGYVGGHDSIYAILRDQRNAQQPLLTDTGFNAYHNNGPWIYQIYGVRGGLAIPNNYSIPELITLSLDPSGTVTTFANGLSSVQLLANTSPEVFVTLPAGRQLRSDTPNPAPGVVVDRYILGQLSVAAAADTTITLNHEAIPTEDVVEVTSQTLPAGTWTTLTGGLDLIPSTIGQATITRPFLSGSQGVALTLEYECWYKTSSTDTQERSRRGSDAYLTGVNTSFADITNSTNYNLGVGYIQYIWARDKRSGREWRIIYTVDGGDASATMDYTYWPESRPNPFA
ncbi:MAG: hypothetical protein AAGA46_00525 [Cyanobacteria bacterium P01_F01_bin.13]